LAEFISEIGNNKILMTTVIAWMVAQSLKVFIGTIRERRFNFKWLVGTGGMPSAHAAGVSALAVSTGFEYGWDSAVFAVALIFTFVTMFDAQGVRRAAGKQAGILNRIIDDIYFRKKIGEDRLMELLGHTPIQVLVGSALGIYITFLCYR